ncbi:hypothetical protein ACFCXH_00235 [Streptomyces nojiriensis]
MPAVSVTGDGQGVDDGAAVPDQAEQVAGVLVKPDRERGLTTTTGRSRT